MIIGYFLVFFNHNCTLFITAK